MNDKNFIEELRQKREEYGVTQTMQILLERYAYSEISGTFILI